MNTKIRNALFGLMLGLPLVVTPLAAQSLLGTTRVGELIEIDLTAGTATLIGDVGTLGDGRKPGWSGLSIDQGGNLFAVSRQGSETSGTPHLYRIDPATGGFLAEIGDAVLCCISDIDFAPDDTLYCPQDNTPGATTLQTLNTATAALGLIGTYGSGLGNGGLSVHPVTGEIWGTVSNGTQALRALIFKVDPATGQADPQSIVQLGLNGAVLEDGRGLDALEILPDGTFIGSDGTGFIGNPRGVYQINPVRDATSGLAEMTFIPLVMDPAIAAGFWGINGLESIPSSVPDTDDDGIPDDEDNCPDDANSNQADLDEDGEGDVCDNDDDGDGVLDGADNCPLDVNPDQDDFDLDGAGDPCDSDDDGDDVFDADDECLSTPAAAITNVDGCAIADLCPCIHPDGMDKWKSHGKYVSCVAHAANDFRDAALISDSDHGYIVSEAGQSACGVKIK